MKILVLTHFETTKNYIHHTHSGFWIIVAENVRRTMQKSNQEKKPRDVFDQKHYTLCPREYLEIFKKNVWYIIIAAYFGSLSKCLYAELRYMYKDPAGGRYV